MSDILVTVPVYNAEKYIKKCLKSVQLQTQKDFKCVVVDDASTDNTYKIAKQFEKDNRFKVIKNDKNKGALANNIKMIEISDLNDEDIVCHLDGDDWLASKSALEKIKEKYNNTDCLLTHGSYVFSDGRQAPAHHKGGIPYHVKKRRTYRNNIYFTSHMRTFKFKLWKELDLEDLKDSDGSYYRAGNDLSYMFPLCEMAGSRIEHISDIIYCYNNKNPINDHKVNRKDQLAAEKEIRQKERYPNLENKI